MGEQQRRDEQAGDDDVVRGRPGRRSLEDRQTIVLELLGGKASVDQLASDPALQLRGISLMRQACTAATCFERVTSKTFLRVRVRSLFGL